MNLLTNEMARVIAAERHRDLAEAPRVPPVRRVRRIFTPVGPARRWTFTRRARLAPAD